MAPSQHSGEKFHHILYKEFIILAKYGRCKLSIVPVLPNANAHQLMFSYFSFITNTCIYLGFLQSKQVSLFPLLNASPAREMSEIQPKKVQIIVAVQRSMQSLGLAKALFQTFTCTLQPITNQRNYVELCRAVWAGMKKMRYEVT